MGIYGILKSTFRLSLEAAILVLLITFIPGLPPDLNFSQSHKVAKVVLDGKLALNTKLDKVEVLHKDELHGPESFADDGFIYTSLHSGDIVKLVDKHIVPIVKFGKPCKGFHEEEICGRPLGIRFGSDGYLYAADAYYGIFKVDVKTGDKKRIVSIGQEIEGRKTRVPNGVAVACNGDVYWTDSSTEVPLYDGFYTLLSDPTGRLVHYNAKTGVNKVLVDNISFANGVILSSNEDFVLVVESNRNRILRYYLKGPKMGTKDIFIDDLPGGPDNIQTDGKSGFLVSLILEAHTKHPNLIQSLSQFPNVRKFLARCVGLAELTFKGINRFYPNEFCQKAVHAVGHISLLAHISPGKTSIVHISNSGEILDVLWSTNKTISLFSEAHIVKDQLYLGSPFNNFLGRIPLSKIGWEHLTKKQNSLTDAQQRCSQKYGEATPRVIKPVNVAPEITTTTPRPTTTTPRPTTTTTTPRPTTTTTTPRPSTTTPRPTTTTSRPTTTAPRSTTTTKPITTSTPKTTQSIPKATMAPKINSDESKPNPSPPSIDPNSREPPSKLAESPKISAKVDSQSGQARKRGLDIEESTQTPKKVSQPSIGTQEKARSDSKPEQVKLKKNEL